MSADQNSYSKSGMFTLVLSMVASLGVMLYVAFFSGGIDLKEVHEEAAQAPVVTAGQPAAEAAKHYDVASVKDPWVSSPDMIGRGHELFGTNCAMCHGANGAGDGPAGAGLKPPPRNFLEGKWKKGGTRLGLMGVLENGLPPSAMQSYKHLPINDRWALVHYIRSITNNLVQDDDKEVAAKAASLK